MRYFPEITGTHRENDFAEFCQRLEFLNFRKIAFVVRFPLRFVTKKKQIVGELRGIFSNATEKTYKNVSHSYDKSGKSKQHQTGFLLKNNNDDDHIRVECMDWSKKFENENNWQDNLSVSAFSKEILMWFKSGYE